MPKYEEQRKKMVSAVVKSTDKAGGIRRNRKVNKTAGDIAKGKPNISMVTDRSNKPRNAKLRLMDIPIDAKRIKNTKKYDRGKASLAKKPRTLTATRKKI